jgi:hypothetical protein
MIAHETHLMKKRPAAIWVSLCSFDAQQTVPGSWVNPSLPGGDSQTCEIQNPKERT